MESSQILTYCRRFHGRVSIVYIYEIGRNIANFVAQNDCTGVGE